MNKFYENTWFLIGVFVFIIFIVIVVSIFLNHIHNIQSKHSAYSVWAEGRQSYLDYVKNNELSDEIEVICNELMEKHFDETFYFGLFPARLENLKEPFLEGCLHEKIKNEDKGFRITFSDENLYPSPYESYNTQPKKNNSKKDTISKKTSNSSSSGNDLYFGAYKLGYALASKHSYYKGNAYIERECKGFVENYLGGSASRDADYVFIRGCVNGYKEAFGK